MDNPSQLATPAWRLVGLTRSVPGVLRLDEGRVRFVTNDGTTLDAPVAALENVRFPWYYFNGGVKMTNAGEEFRFSFLKPDAGDEVPEHLLAGVAAPSQRSRLADAAGSLVADFEVASFARGRKAGKAWKGALAQPQSPP